MQYLDGFTLASENDEREYILSFDHKLTMTCYRDNVYPFKLFPYKQLGRLKFSPITLLCGGNGSGKSTLLNIIAQKLGIERTAPFNNTPFFEEYLSLCSYRLSEGADIPKGSRIITSDDVFDFLLNVRRLNEGVDRKRDRLFNEYESAKETHFQLKSLDDYLELKRHNEAKRCTKSAYVSRRLPQNLGNGSNGESAYTYFTQQIQENALYLLDEPENSLSPGLQNELAGFIADSVRFYGCQFLISTHSPFLMSLRDAAVYDLDAVPVCCKRWTELENIRVYHDFFEAHKNEF